MSQNDIGRIANYIRQLRESKNYSQEYMAAKMKMSQNSYSKIELNYSKLTVDRLIQIARLLDTDAGTLIAACGYEEDCAA
ncbi:helix-turn-helix protein [Mucilaginibacter oryzae]|uniref:Helix-turn-helix protein n=1 Tax=Mucilaginibacter oryzae TaxID=468058 RepID=A0A316HD38_9SPHI|nr:helix-turn-helix transcriptional regulator [Mucilaginibacter oryzae]PWK78327.1 helix-turn-helix protein [Mucilaginibacter oryzae]